MKFNRVLSLVLVAVLVFSLSSFVFASGLVGETASSVGTFWTAVNNTFLLSSLNQWSLASLTGDVCAFSDDGLHHGPITSVDIGPAQGDATGPYFVTCRCTHCGNSFQTQTFQDPLNNAYKEHVGTLPVEAIDSDYNLVWYPTVYDMRVRLSDDSLSKYLEPSTLLGITAVNHFLYIKGCPDYATPTVSGNAREFSTVYSVPDSEEYLGSPRHRPLCFIAPCAGSYQLLDSPKFKFDFLRYGSSLLTHNKASYGSKDLGSFVTGDPFFVSSSTSGSLGAYVNVISMIGTFYLPAFKIQPAVPLDTGVGGSFGPNTRPGDMTGDFGYVGENGDVSKVGDTYFFDESSTTYNNPVTGDTSNVTNWTYDYSDRSYTVVTDSGNTVTITYGDETVNVSEYTVNEDGDTITTNYTYYYITNNTSPSPGPDTPDTPHTHNYSETVTQAPTCIMSGVKTFTCSCGDSYTQNVAATGHSWVVKETVLTQYDDSGNLLQQGYTIFRCSICGEENKSETSTVPPGGSGSGTGSGPGSGGLFSGIFSIIWDFFSFFWSFFNDFVVGGIRGFLNGLLSAAGSFLSFLNPFNWFS